MKNKNIKYALFPKLKKIDNSTEHYILNKPMGNKIMVILPKLYTKAWCHGSYNILTKCPVKTEPLTTLVHLENCFAVIWSFVLKLEDASQFPFKNEWERNISTRWVASLKGRCLMVILICALILKRNFTALSNFAGKVVGLFFMDWLVYSFLGFRT